MKNIYVVNGKHFFIAMNYDGAIHYTVDGEWVSRERGNQILQKYRAEHAEIEIIHNTVERSIWIKELCVRQAEAKSFLEMGKWRAIRICMERAI